MADEVLVHISTPATRQNDELFRSLADAYAEFEPYRIHRDETERKKAKASLAAGLRPDASSTRAEETLTREASDPLVPTASKESYGSFPSNLSSEGHHQGYDPAPVADDSMRPISRLAQLDRSYLSWRKRATPTSSFQRGQEELKTSSDGPEDADTGFIEDSQSALQALQSQLQDTYSTTSAETSEDDDQEEIFDNNHKRPFRGSSPTHSQHHRIAEEVALPTLLEDNTQANPETSPVRELMDVSLHASRASQIDFDSGLDQPDFSKLPIDAFPPPPETSVMSPGSLPSQVTNHLAAIKTKNPNRFRPSRIRRDLETDERGYWRVECMHWPPKIQQDFWSSLCEHVCSGRIGWGTTLHRESGSGHTLGLVRLYCWGEVVEHMWLLVWLCSRGKVSSLGSRWIDANGIAVVEMNWV